MFYADFELYLHTELDAKGQPKLYPASAILDPNLRECANMRRYRPFEPSAEANTPDLADYGILFVNVDRWRTISRVLGGNNSLHHYRAQGHFMFRTNVSAWPINTERLEVVIESQPEALGEKEGLFFCTMPEFSGPLSPHYLATHHSPILTRHSPLPTPHSPLRTPHSPLPTLLSPLATPHSPLATHRHLPRHLRPLRIDPLPRVHR